MKIIVKNNDAVKAYKVLMKKLNKDGFFQELKNKKFYRSKGQKDREKHKLAVIKAKKEQTKRQEILLKEEKRVIIDAKKRSRERKKRLKGQNTKQI